MPGVNLMRLVGHMSLPVGLDICEAEQWMDRLLDLIQLDHQIRIAQREVPDALPR